ncbi:MAG: MlaA family lipoprotein [Gammaproteobacteria bacterium]
MLTRLLPLALVTLGGCASQEMTIRTLPPETPAADIATAAEHAAGPTAVVPAPAGAQDPPQAAAPIPQEMPDDAPSMHTYDPWERVNRFTYRFNARFDEALFLPIANGYRRLPGPLRSGVGNFFGNLGEVHSMINYALQGRLGLGARSLERFLLNSTVGIGGLFDLATTLKLPGGPTGLSATLGKWGLHPGPYLVIPFLGPSTLRDGIGAAGDFGTSYSINVADLYRGNKTWFVTGTYLIDKRANSSFRYYATGSPFEYETIRFLYVRKRLIEDDGLRKHSAPKPHDPDAPAGQ